MALYQNSSETQGLCLKFSNDKDKWLPVSLSEIVRGSPGPAPESFTFASYNVLMNNLRRKFRLTELVFNSEKRFKYQCSSLFKNLNADFLALCEVTDQYLNVLFKSDFIKANYYMSPIIEEAYYKKHGVLILSKHPFWSFSFNDICGHGRVQAALFVLSETKAFVAAGLHLTAYEENSHVRRREFKSFLKGLRELESFCGAKELLPYIRLALAENNIIIMGDLNFHLPIETNILTESKFSDLWLETEEIRSGLQRKVHPLGYTWDPAKNKFINYWLPFDNRRMRLDRVAVYDANSLFEERSPLEIFAYEPMAPKARCPPGSFLYPSDHFGLKITLGIKAKPSQRKECRPKLLDESDNSLYGTGYRRMSEIRALRKKVLLSCAIVFLLVFLWMLGFVMRAVL